MKRARNIQEHNNAVAQKKVLQQPVLGHIRWSFNIYRSFSNSRIKIEPRATLQMIMKFFVVLLLLQLF